MPTSPGKIYDLAAAFRKAQLNNERAAAVELVHRYGDIWQNIDRRIRDLTRLYYEEIEAGRIPPSGWLSRMERLQSLRAHVEQEMMRFADYAETSIRMQQWQAIQAGKMHAQSLLYGALPDGVMHAFNVLPQDALASMIGFLQDGSPLRELLQRLGLEAARLVGDGLIQGLALGQSPAVIARNIRALMGGKLAEALRLARTEILRAYREASHQTYNLNDDIVEGWIWLSGRNTRTCAACWALDGTFHTMDERLDDHPNGRCTSVPKLIGIDSPVRSTGLERFDQLKISDQLQVLGSSKYAAWQNGTISLPDLVGEKQSAEYGRMFYERSLREMGIDAREEVRIYKESLDSVKISEIINIWTK